MCCSWRHAVKQHKPVTDQLLGYRSLILCVIPIGCFINATSYARVSRRLETTHTYSVAKSRSAQLCYADADDNTEYISAQYCNTDAVERMMFKYTTVYSNAKKLILLDVVLVRD